MSSYFQEIGKTRAEKRIAALLDPVQRARLAQIERQVQLLGRHQALGGPLRPLRSDPAKSLQLTKEQGAKLDAIGDEYRQRIAQLPRVPPGVADPKMVAQERRSALEKIAALLTPEQKKVWDDLIGPPFLGSLPASPQAPSRPSPSGSASSSDSPLTGAEAGTLDQRYRQYAEKLIPKYDTNGDGVLTQDEWSSMSENPEAADADGDKRITVEEYARWRTAQAEKEHPAEETRYQAVPSPPSPTKTASGANSIDTKPIVIEGWGQVIDPDCDCTVKGERGKLTVNVPATLHDLNGRNGKLNAPRVLQEVEGDFVAQVRVSGAFEPGGKTTAPQSFPFNGAGLIIWADEKNYTRLERNMYLAWGIPTCFPPLFEVFKDGQYQGTDPPPTRSAFFKGESTCFRLERKGDKITAHYSHDGKEWTALKEVTVGLPKKVQVGVAAINTSDKPLTVEFDEFSVRAGE